MFLKYSKTLTFIDCVDTNYEERNVKIHQLTRLIFSYLVASIS